MKTKQFSKSFSLFFLTVVMLFALAPITFAAQKDATTLTANDVKSLQAITDMTPYGQGLTQVEIVYQDSVDLSGLSVGNYQSIYTLEDRGTQTPDYGQVRLSGLKVDGQTVTLFVYQDTYATETNALIYNGDNKTGSRSRNAFGIYCTGAWFRAKDGTIYYGKEDDAEKGYKAIPAELSKMRLNGYQKRESLELRLRHKADDEANALCLTDDKGKYTAANKWLETQDIGFNTDDGRGTFKSFEEMEIQIPSTGANLTKAVKDPYVRGFLYVPKNYDASKKYPLVFTFTGDGTSFWITEDGTNNFGTGVMYDAATTAWLGEEAIVVNVHDRSAIGASYTYTADDDSLKTAQDLDYDYVVDDVNVMKYLIENYSVDPTQIIIHGNSRSTMAASTIIQALAGQPYTNDQDAMTWGSSERTKTLSKDVYDFTIGTFLCNNGLFGGPTSGYDLWTSADRLAVAKTGLRAWIFDAEQDFNNIDAVEKQTAAYKEAGKDDNWIKENLRLTAFPSELFYYWGESDHSTTRINYWYFGEPRNGRGIYYGSDCDVVDGVLTYKEKTKIGDTYEVITRGVRTTGGDQGKKDGHKYTVYGDNFICWALNKPSVPDTSAIEGIQATAEACFYGYKVGKVEITYKAETDLSGVQLENYAVYDRGFNNPEFGALPIIDMTVDVERNTVTLIIDSQKSDKVTDRSRETYGTLCTSSAWYIDSEGKLHYGTEETTDKLGVTIYPNNIGKGLQRRENLDLVLCVGGASVKDGIASTNGVGERLDDTVWEKTRLVDDLNKVELKMVSLDKAAEGYELINKDNGTKGYVPVFVIWPDNYDPNRTKPYPVVDYQTGGGVCYWEVVDGKGSDGKTYEGAENASNPGCNTVYDVMMTEWHRQYPDAIIMSVNVHSTNTEISAAEIAGVLDYAVTNWNADASAITLVGNSQGTIIASDVVRQRPDLINAYVECNGNFGAMISATADMEAMDGTVANSSFKNWTAAEVKAMIDNEVSTWMFNGETDGANPAVAQDTYNVLKKLYTDAGKSEEWIDQHVHISGLLSWQFKEWGETDHSVTKVVAWKYLESPYNDPTGTTASGTYKFGGKETNQANYIYPTYKPMTDFEYKVYDESVVKWVKTLNNENADIESIQATAEACFYGYKVGKVEIVYKDGTDLSGVKLTDYAVYDRGFNNPEFGALPIIDMTVEGNTVTLIIDSQKSDKITDRTRETYGTLCTSSAWYIDSEGKLHYGSEETTDKLGVTIYPNKINKGLQRRKNLDLVLCVGGSSVSIKNGIASTNGTGEMLDKTVWEETILDDDLDKVEMEMVKLDKAAEGYELINKAQGTTGCVPVFVIWPEKYDAKRAEPYPVIDYQTGMGVCYWEMVNGKATDGNTSAGDTDANNPGCNTVYDVMMTEWHRQYPDAIIMSVNVHYHDIVTSAAEIAGVLDYAIENWNVDKDNITIVGNSQGTLIASDVIRQRPDLINAYVECNGNFGARFTDAKDMDAMDGTVANSSFKSWTTDEVNAVIKNEVSVWLLNGEADGENPAVAQDTYNVLTALYEDAGKSKAWINRHVRISGFLSWQFKAWGESDHSVTKLVAWKYLADPYNDPEGTATSGTYKLSGAETTQPNYKYPLYRPMTEFEYTIYDDSVAEWVKNLNIPAPVLSVSEQTVNLTAGKEMTPFTITATDGDNVTWTTSAADTLKAGLTGTPANDGISFTISGTPAAETAGKTFDYVVTATNSVGYAQAKISFVVASSGSKTVTTDPVSAEIETSSKTAQETVKNEEVVKKLIEKIFGESGLPEGVSSEVSTLDDDNATTTPKTFTAAELQTALENAGVLLTESEDNFVVLETIQVTESKIYMFAIPKDKLTPGMKIFLHLLMNVVSVGNSSVLAADGKAEEAQNAVFMDDNGNIIDTVPEGSDVNIVAYMEPGNTYTPVIASAEDENNEIGGSGGGCYSGFGAGTLSTLAVLFLAFRKKHTI